MKKRKISKRNTVLSAWQSKMAVVLRHSSKECTVCIILEEKKPCLLCKSACRNFEKKLRCPLKPVSIFRLEKKKTLKKTPNS